MCWSYLITSCIITEVTAYNQFQLESIQQMIILTPQESQYVRGTQQKLFLLQPLKIVAASYNFNLDSWQVLWSFHRKIKKAMITVFCK